MIRIISFVLLVSLVQYCHYIVPLIALTNNHNLLTKRSSFRKCSCCATYFACCALLLRCIMYTRMISSEFFISVAQIFYAFGWKISYGLLEILPVLSTLQSL